MISAFLYRFRIFFIGAAIVMMAGCGASNDQGSYAYNPSHHSSRPEPLSPLEAHMQARKNVNPKDMRVVHNYTAGTVVPPEFEPFHMAIKPKRKPRYRAQRATKELVTLDKMLPAKTKLIVAEEDLHKIHPQRKPDTQVIYAAKPEQKPAVEITKLPAPKATGDVIVTSLRLGVHPGKMRFVLDMSGAAGFGYDMDNETGVLMIDLPGVGWSTASSRLFQNNSLIEAYIAKARSGGGTLLAIKLRKPSKIVFSAAFAPDKTRGHRIVFDVAPL